MQPKMRLWSAAALIAVVLLVGFALSVPRLHDAGAPAHSADSASVVPNVYLHDAYGKGVHTLTLKLSVPTQCTTASGTTTVEPAATTSLPDTVLIALDLPSDQGVCLVEPATTTLSLSAQARAGAVFVVSINGSTASTTRY